MENCPICSSKINHIEVGGSKGMISTNVYGTAINSKKFGEYPNDFQTLFNRYEELKVNKGLIVF